MKTLFGSLILISGVLAAGLGVAGGQVSRPGLKVGDKAPDFSLPNPDGRLVALGDYTAHGPVVVIFYRGFW
jgi:hypothetical protein